MARFRSRQPLPNLDPSTETALDWVFFVLGGIAAIWLAWVLLRESFSFGWWQIAFVIFFWGMLAYLVLPRLHGILTRIYVPDYFIGRARTSDGLLGDPVNVAILGWENQIHAAMLAAGWTRADDLSVRTGLRIVRSTLLRRSYLEAPVSPLLLFGRKQDFAYQQEVDGTPGKRHHVRFWRCPEGWLLPGGSPTDWLAAGTYDRSVGFSLFTMQVTHKIAADTDVERDHVVATVLASNPAASSTTIEGFSAGYHSRNGGGDSIVTDGDLPVLNLRALPRRDDQRDVSTDSRDRRPAPIVVGAGLLALSGLTSIVNGVVELVESGPMPATVAEEAPELGAGILIIVAALFFAVGLASTLIAWRVFLGKPLARIISMALAVIGIGGQILTTELGGAQSLTANLPSVALSVLVLLALSSSRAAIYSHRETKAPKRISGLPGDAAPF